MTTLPKHILTQLHRLIGEGLPAEQIAFMMRLNQEAVDAEIERFNTTKKKKVALSGDSK
jgi:hypothetical protein